MVIRGFKSVYVFFIHWIDSKFLWYVHNVFIINIYLKIYINIFYYYLQSKVQKIK